MIAYRVLFGYLGIIFKLAGFFPYFRNIFTGHTKPHAFSWLVWSALTGLAFSISLSEGGGLGAWVTGITSLGCFVIFLLALFKGDRKFHWFDWLALLSAFIALALWRTTNDPITSVILITITDVLGFLPSFRKGYGKPFEETASAFALDAIGFSLGILALETFTFSTWFYPATIALTDGSFALMIWLRRRTK